MQSVTRSGIFGFGWPSPPSASTPADSERPPSSPPPTRAEGGRVLRAGSSDGLPSDIEIRLQKHLPYGDTVCKTHKITKSQVRKIFL